MVSRSQSLLIQTSLLFTLSVFAADEPSKKSGGSTVPSTVVKKKFYRDDPLWAEPTPREVKNVKGLSIDNLYDFVEQSFVVPHVEKHVERSRQDAALNCNTLGEVPDSEWYTNRHALHPMSIDELVRGSGNSNPPETDGKWKVISAKNDGVTPGVVIEDNHRNRYLLKFDPPDYPELASAPDVIGSKFYYALGYNTPENYIVYFRPDQLVLTEASSWKDSLGKKHLLKQSLINEWLSAQHKDEQGRYRALASRWIAGKPLGPFAFEGTRSDDPNDIVPHERRRELRGMDVIAAWLNDTDAKSINTLDSLVEENGREYIKHFRIDWGASLGSDSLRPKDVRRGHDYFVDPKPTLFQAATFGVYVPKWMRIRHPYIKGVGTFDAESFDAANWKSNYPNTAFLLMDDDDAFWAAKKVMAFSDADIRAIVETGRYSDPEATAWVTETLIKRRDKIGKAWLSRGLALDNFRVADGRLVFVDLAEKYKVSGPRQVTIRWSEFDNGNNQRSPIETNGEGASIPARAGQKTGFLAASIKAAQDGKAAQEGSNTKAPEVTVYLRGAGGVWSVVGIDRNYGN
jgi:hypothetical protein